MNPKLKTALYVFAMLAVFGGSIGSNCRHDRAKHKAETDLLAKENKVNELQGRLTNAQTDLAGCKQQACVPMTSDMQRALSGQRGLTCRLACSVVGEARRGLAEKR